ncbi:MAG TPA: sulfatase-like hydrolase/transferase [Clostridiaceae bacterium]|nr:sulfatase-like hydrolase/transferase [Clostridiaceae bacterium]
MKRKMKTALFSFLLVSLCYSVPAHAYIDPATTTYIIQIVTALVITLGVTIGIFFTKIRLSIVGLYVRVSEFFIRLFSRKRDKGDKKLSKQMLKVSASPGEPSLKKRFLSAACVSIAFAFTFIVFGIYELYMLNVDSFNFPLKALFPSVALFGALVAVILCIVLVLFRGRVFEFLISLIFGILLAGYVQGNFLNRGLGILTGDSIDWSAQSGAFLLNLLVWIAIVSMPFLLRAYKIKLWSRVIKIVSCLLVIVQVVSMIALKSTSSTTPQRSNRYLSTKGIDQVAEEKNVIVFVLDRLDNIYINGVKGDDPHFFDRLDGFTQFTNNISLYSQTFPSVTNMFTGELHLFERPASDYLKEAWSTSTFLPELHRHEYAIHLFMEPGYTFKDAADIEHIVDNVVENEIRIHTRDALEQFGRLSVFRYAPLFAKPFYWTSTDQFARLVQTESTKECPPYVTDDLHFYKQLKDKKIHKNGGDKKFVYIHLQGSHAPHVMNEYAEPAALGSSNAIIQTKGCFRIVYEYIDQLKQLGLYESSTIIITGDHGARKNDTTLLERAIVTALFVKPAGKAGTPLAFNSAPVSTDNFRPFIYSEVGIPHDELGKTYFEVSEDAEDARYLYHRLIKTSDSPPRLLIYEIQGDANQFENWQLVEDWEIGY